MTRTIQTTYRYRLNPTVVQETLLNQFAGARRWVWNWALDRKMAHYRQTGTTLSYHDLAGELTQLKQQPETAWLREMDSQSLQQALRDLESAYQQFFRRIKRGEKRKGFPRFTSRKTDTPRFRIPQRVVLHAEAVAVPKIGMIRAVVHRPLEGVTKGATFKREPNGHWFVSIVTEQQAASRTERPVQTHVGVDVGLKSLAVYSTGETIANPRWYRTQSRKVRRAQQALSRKLRGSHNRGKARVVVARLHQKIRNQRSDFLHKLSTNLVRHYDLVSIEDLSVRGLAKTKLAKSVLDAGWGMFRAMREYKADRNDSHVVAIGRFFASTKMCGACGWEHDITLAMREWDCLNPECGVHHDRDLNAARNIDQEGMRLFKLRVAAGDAETQNACGDSVSPTVVVGAG